MISYYAADLEPVNAPYIRLHPYLEYYNLKENPALIRAVLEDFRAFDEDANVQLFYSFIEWINGDESILETNDCAFRPPCPFDQSFLGSQAHTDRNYRKVLSATGRVMILYRRLELNIDNASATYLGQSLLTGLVNIDVDFIDGCVAFASVPQIFVNLPVPNLGQVVMLQFWSYGDTEQETMDNLGRLFNNLFTVTRNFNESN